MAPPMPKKDAEQSLLQVANKAGNLEIAHYLIDKGIDVNYMEPDHGLSTECYICPVLIDAVRFLFDDFFCEGDTEGRIELIKHLVEKGADPNKTDNEQGNAWDEAINTYTDLMDDVENTEEEKLYEDLLKEVLDVLYPHADILNIDRIDRDLKEYRRYSLFLKNLILNRDDLYGVEPEEVAFWKDCWFPIIPIVKPFYMKNNPHYGNDM